MRVGDFEVQIPKGVQMQDADTIGLVHGKGYFPICISHSLRGVRVTLKIDGFEVGTIHFEGTGYNVWPEDPEPEGNLTYYRPDSPEAESYDPFEAMTESVSATFYPEPLTPEEKQARMDMDCYVPVSNDPVLIQLLLVPEEVRATPKPPPKISPQPRENPQRPEPVRRYHSTRSAANLGRTIGMLVTLVGLIVFAATGQFWGAFLMFAVTFGPLILFAIIDRRKP